MYGRWPGRLGGRVGEIAEHAHVVEAAEGARQVRFDEAQRAAQALESDLDEDAGRILDVVARRLHQPRHLVELREHAPRPLGQRRVVEEHLAGEARREQIAVELGIALPGADGLELEEPRADARVERRTLQPLDVGQPRRVDRRQPPGEAAEIADLRVNRRLAEIFQQVVVKVDAVEGRVGRVGLVEPRKVLVDEMRQGFGGIHSGRIGAPRMAGILYVVATPIGNLEDVTLRALRILREVSLIAAEDTRRTARLLQHYSISTRTTSLHEHNEREKSPQLVDRLLAGESIALVSDAGTPLISDPGETLVAAARAAGIRVESIPGPSAVMAALSSSGLQTASSSFWVSRQIGQKTKKGLQKIRSEPRLVVFFEAPHRILGTLTDLEVWGPTRRSRWDERSQRPTKSWSLVLYHELLAYFTAPKGEFTLLLPPWTGPGVESCPLAAKVHVEFGELTKNKGLQRRQALKIMADRYGIGVNEFYKLLGDARS